MMRGPGDGFYGGGVGGKSPEGFVMCSVPDKKLIIISSGRELTFFGIPSQTTNFLFMRCEFAEIVVWYTNVSMEYAAIS